MEDALNGLKLAVDSALESAKTDMEVEAIEIKYLGRKGELTAMLKNLTNVPAADRPVYGAMANGIKRQMETAISAKRRILSVVKMANLADTERVDVTEPGERPPEGHLHVTTQAINELTTIFEKIGFTRTRYPEVDWDWYAFEALNMPADHPARDEWETFFMDAPGSKKGRMVLTPHTSNGQIHELEKGDLPIRMINIAKCYRRQIDATHIPMFHQIEGLYVDRNVSITHLRGVLDYFAKAFFGPDRVTRLRPFHFRFTEPSFEIDISCGVCGGTGINTERQKCRVCKRGWVELGGAGMVHPNVFKACNVDPKKWSGLAFGWGVERTFMMKSGLQIDDIRTLYKNDLRFLKQF